MYENNFKTDFQTFDYFFFKVSTPLRYPLISMIDEIENKSLKGIFDFRFKRKNILILDLVFLI